MNNVHPQTKGQQILIFIFSVIGFDRNLILYLYRTNKMHLNLTIFSSILWLSVASATEAVTMETVDRQEQEVFARVGDSTISVQTYRQALNSEGRNLFYHGQPPEEELTAFQQKVADKLIDRQLLVQEVYRRGLVVDKAALDNKLEKYRNRVRRHGQEIDENSEQWLRLRQWAEEELLIQQLEQVIRESVSIPSEDVVKDYYSEHPDKFTEPEQQHLSTILLQVAPSSPPETWEAAKREAQEIVERLRAGADFTELASLHSGDASAENGGDMGYLHKGMISDEAQVVIDKLAIGEISDPLTVLEGVVIFRLHDKRPGTLQDFQQVRQRVQKLWQSDEADRQWREFVDNLWTVTSIHIEKKYLTLTGEIDGKNDGMDNSTN
jgi:parvulin-like peptidyl-prolyl isomerase